jgi:hypothetical protein
MKQLLTTGSGQSFFCFDVKVHVKCSYELKLERCESFHSFCNEASGQSLIAMLTFTVKMTRKEGKTLLSKACTEFSQWVFLPFFVIFTVKLAKVGTFSESLGKIPTVVPIFVRTIISMLLISLNELDCRRT